MRRILLPVRHISRSNSPQTNAIVLTSHDLDLRNAMAISQYDTDLRWSCALLREFADLIDNGIGCSLEPGGCCARVWEGRGADALAIAVHATHFGGWYWIAWGFEEMALLALER